MPADQALPEQHKDAPGLPPLHASAPSGLRAGSHQAELRTHDHPIDDPAADL